MGTAKGKDNGGEPPVPPAPTGKGKGGQEVLEEISLVVEPYGDVPNGASTAKKQTHPEIYEVEGELLPFDTSPDY